MTVNQDELGIIEYLIDAGLLADEANAIATRILNGERNLSVDEQEVFRREVAEEFFQLACVECGAPIPQADIPDAFESGDDDCRHCRHPE